MADNVAITAGTGTSIAADDISSVFYQRVKLSLGADGSAVDAVAGAGAVGTGVQRMTLASDDPAVASLASAVTALQIIDDWDSSDSCKVVTPISITTVTLSLDTSAYADGDVLADTQIVTNCFRINDGFGVIDSITVLDEDDQGAGFDLIFLDSNVSLGTENAAPSITDANARNILGWVRVSAADFIDLGGSRLATLTGLSLAVKAVSGTDDMYVAAISRGTGTYTASGIQLRIGISQS
jgi:hypothetical protein